MSQQKSSLWSLFIFKRDYFLQKYEKTAIKDVNSCYLSDLISEFSRENIARIIC